MNAKKNMQKIVSISSASMKILHSFHIVPDVILLSLRVLKIWWCYWVFITLG